MLRKLAISPALLVLVVAITSCSVSSNTPSEFSMVPSMSNTTVTTAEVVSPPSSPAEGPIESGSSFPSFDSYGDFSGLSPLEVDTFEATRLLAACIRDRGFNVEVIPPGDGISFEAVPATQNSAAQAAEQECRDGLNLREGSASDYTDEVRSHIYDYQLALRQCLIEAGYDIPDPPSREIYVENYFRDPWIPYSFLPVDALNALDPESIIYRCPQYPPGGIMNWSAEDPIPALRFPD